MCRGQTYKIVENKAEGKKYLLKQRGCPNPSDSTVTALRNDAATFGGEFDVPLKSVAVTSSTYFPFLEQMGERPALRLYNTGTKYGATGCMQKQYEDGWTKAKSLKWDSTNGWYADANWNSAFDTGEADTDPALATIEATFTSSLSHSNVNMNSILLSDTAEPTFYGRGEWMEYMALWFNREQVGISSLSSLVLDVCCTCMRPRDCRRAKCRRMVRLVTHSTTGTMVVCQAGGGVQHRLCSIKLGQVQAGSRQAADGREQLIWLDDCDQAQGAHARLQFQYVCLIRHLQGLGCVALPQMCRRQHAGLDQRL